MSGRLTFYVRMALYALLTVPLTAVVLIATAPIAAPPDGGPLGDVIPLGVIGLILAGVVYLLRRVPIPVVIVSSILFLFAALIGFDFGFRHPEAFHDFVSVVGLFTGSGVATLAGIVSIVRRRRGTVDDPPAPAQRRPFLAVAVIGVIAVIASAGVTIATGPASARPGDVATVVMEVDRFVPWEFVAVSGERATFAVRNRDDYAHTFTIDELKIDQYVGPLAERRITFDVDHAPGEFRLYCDIRGHENMVGTVTVE